MDGLWLCTAQIPDLYRLAKACNLLCLLLFCMHLLPQPSVYWCRHTSRFLVIWLGLMPFTLWKSCHWAMVPASAIICFLLLGIEEIGVQIEEPFGILPLGELNCLLFMRYITLHITPHHKSWPVCSGWTWFLLGMAECCSLMPQNLSYFVLVTNSPISAVTERSKASANSCCTSCYIVRPRLVRCC